MAYDLDASGLPARLRPAAPDTAPGTSHPTDTPRTLDVVLPPARRGDRDDITPSAPPAPSGVTPPPPPPPRREAGTEHWIAEGSVLRSRYRLGPAIGRGGMADVYRATDEVLGRQVAVKVFRPGTDGATERRRFLSEVRTIAGLTHPHLVSLYDGGQDDQPWCVMNLVDGGTLADLPLDVDPCRVARIGAQIADALAYIHDRGIVHRDVKPSNVLLDHTEDAFLSDFGVAQMIDGTRLTATGTLLGTAAYLSPEQVLGRGISPAVDVYALALVLLETLTGVREYPGTPVESAVARLARAPQIPESLGPDWLRLLQAMTAREPHDRPDAAASAVWLDMIARGVPTPSGPVRAAGAGPDAPGHATRSVQLSAAPRPSLTASVPRQTPLHDGAGRVRSGVLHGADRARLVVGAVAVALAVTAVGVTLITQRFQPVRSDVTQQAPVDDAARYPAGSRSGPGSVPAASTATDETTVAGAPAGGGRVIGSVPGVRVTVGPRGRDGLGGPVLTTGTSSTSQATSSTQSPTSATTSPSTPRSTTTSPTSSVSVPPTSPTSATSPPTSPTTTGTTPTGTTTTGTATPSPTTQPGTVPPSPTPGHAPIGSP